ESAFPMLAIAERESGSVIKGMRARRKRDVTKAPRRHRASLYSFAGGMHELMQVLAERLGDRIRTGSPVRSLRRIGSEYRLELDGGEAVSADEVVLACPAGHGADIVAGLDEQLARELRAIPFASVASVYLGLPAAKLPPQLQGFGFLLERGEKSPVLGAIYVASLFPDHAPPGHALLRVMIGGRRHPDAVERTDASLVELATTTVMRYANCRIEPDFTHVARARTAIAQYESGHAARLSRIAQRLAAHPGLSLRGNSYRAVALSGQIGRASGTDAAGHPEDRLSATTG
ncbi:MAG: protoporphyrinogen oxidase, partial [Planctomycetes bacterium]|nr:protoporphyrinogen oxidase [Planctomycetota bacterium]